MKIIYQRDVPCNQNLLYSTVFSARDAVVGDLDIRLDESSGLIYNHSFDPSRVNYSSDYDNNQTYSSYFTTYISNHISYLLSRYIPSNSTVVEVGCGKGYYIKNLARALPSCEAYGFDTSYVYDGEPSLNNLQYFQEYYSRKHAYLHPDVVICRHVIEHIHNPLDFLHEIRASMPDQSLLFLETPDVNWILKNTSIFDFFYEHCSYWNEASIEHALFVSGFELIELKYEFEGQYMWIIARATNAAPATFSRHNSLEGMRNLCSDFVNKRMKEINDVMDSLHFLKQRNIELFIWGAGAKGTTFVNMFDEEKQLVAALVDISPAKQNKFVGITTHQVVKPDNLRDVLTNLNGGVIAVLNDNYIPEVNNYVRNLRLNCVVCSYAELKSIKKIL
jgi:SAM-dependent methyltransferase